MMKGGGWCERIREWRTTRPDGDGECRGTNLPSTKNEKLNNSSRRRMGKDGEQRGTTADDKGRQMTRGDGQRSPMTASESDCLLHDRGRGRRPRLRLTLHLPLNPFDYVSDRARVRVRICLCGYAALSVCACGCVSLLLSMCVCMS